MSLAVRTGFSLGVMAPKLSVRTGDRWHCVGFVQCAGNRHVEDAQNWFTMSRMSVMVKGLTPNARCQGSSFLEFGGVTGVEKSTRELAG